MRNPDIESRFASGAEVRAARRAKRLLAVQARNVEAQARCIYETLYTEFERWYLERQYNYQWQESDFGSPDWFAAVPEIKY